MEYEYRSAAFIIKNSFRLMALFHYQYQLDSTQLISARLGSARVSLRFPLHSTSTIVPGGRHSDATHTRYPHTQDNGGNRVYAVLHNISNGYITQSLAKLFKNAGVIQDTPSGACNDGAVNSDDSR
ncbi:hypothetical protein R3I94_000612 [Phoxinus phoxinus]